MSTIQSLDWGTIEWVFEPETQSPDHMRVGISTMNPHTAQPAHCHYGDEQFLYILSGYGHQKINNVESEIKPGSFFHISSGMIHESENDGNEPIIKLLISIPAVASPMPVAHDKREKIQHMESIDKEEFLQETIKELFRHNLRPLRIPLSIYNEDQHLVYSNSEFPGFCKKCCPIEENIYNCELYNQKALFLPPYYEGISAFSCHNGLFLYTLPIVCEGELLGFIKTGHIKTKSAGNTEKSANEVYTAPQSTEQGMLDTIRNISQSICTHYQFCKVQVSFYKNKRVLTDKIKEDDKIQEYVKTAQNKVLNLQINQHFLFNTLNTIAGMSIKEHAFQTYEAIGNLAQLFRYTLRTETPFVLLKEEISYVKNYISLQKLRFGERLQVCFDLEDDLLNSCEVPFNFLQPIIENCFVHAFKNNQSAMQLILQNYRDKNELCFRIQDNGEGIPDEKMKELVSNMENGIGNSGTFMILRKLQSVFGNNFSYQLSPVENGGTLVTIRIPVTESERSSDEKNSAG